VEVLLGRERAADAELLRPLLEQRVRHCNLYQQPTLSTNRTKNRTNRTEARSRSEGAEAHRLLLRRDRRLATTLRGLQDSRSAHDN
jgi:hypothetical protein